MCIRDSLLARVDVQRAGHLLGLVRDDADSAALDATEADEHVRREQRLHLEKVAAIEDRLDDRHHVVGLVRAVGNDAVELAVAVGDLSLIHI